MAIRNSCRALVVKDGKVLLCKTVLTRDDRCWWGLPQGAVCYDLPGGGQNQYETLEEAAVRECMEETGYTVEIKRLAGVYEEIQLSETFRAIYEEHVHKVHFIFLCELTDAPHVAPSELNMDMEGAEWVNLAAVDHLPMYPKAFQENLRRMLEAEETLFLDSKRLE